MMKLILSLTLIWMLSSTGGALQCYSGNTTMTCQSNENYCDAFAIRNNGETGRHRGCYSSCRSHTVSYYSDLYNIVQTQKCCNTDRCNNQDLPVPDVQKENGLQCYTCNPDESGVCINNDNRVIQCTGIQDRCISANKREGDKQRQFLGCVSRNVCEAGNTAGIGFTNVTCCESSFCNSAWNVNLNVVLLLLGLILPVAC